MQDLYIQGRSLAPEQLEWIRGLMARHPEWGRFRLSVHIAEQWNWRNGAQQLKDMAARTLLHKLERRGLIALPARRGGGGSRRALAPPAAELAAWTEPVLAAPLSQLQPVALVPVEGLAQRQEVRRLLGQFHYLGYRRPVGENLQYLARERTGRVVACLVFGAAAWKCAVRDHHLGWDGVGRQAGLHLVANHMRFLIPPWVQVPHLASHVLGLAAGRLSGDWRHKYGHGICLLETFVERGRFAGSSYRAANWVLVGSTQGRSRNDRERTLRVPRKDVYLYPLARQFRRALGVSGSPTTRGGGR